MCVCLFLTVVACCVNMCARCVLQHEERVLLCVSVGTCHSLPVVVSWPGPRALNASTFLPLCRASVKTDWQTAFLLRAVQCIDLTTLAGDDTPERVKRLCAKAKSPVSQSTVATLRGPTSADPITCGAVCVYPARVATAAQALKGHPGIGLAAVATGFPAGQTLMPTKLEEIKDAVSAGATEIDIVLSRDAFLTGDFVRLYDEVRMFREACGDAHLKTILATGELPSLRAVHQASMVCMMAGADFIKTSTGKEPTNATIPVSLVMVRAIREYLDHTGYKVGFKPAGGISSAKQTLAYFALMLDELGEEWTRPHLFRFGASSLLTDIERQLHHRATGTYARVEDFPMA